MINNSWFYLSALGLILAKAKFFKISKWKWFVCLVVISDNSGFVITDVNKKSNLEIETS